MRISRRYIIGAFSHGVLAQPYLDSLKKVTNVQIILFQYMHDDGFDTVSYGNNVEIIKIKKKFPGNTGKHKDFRELLSPRLHDEDMYIVTDVHDVRFQKDLPYFDSSVIVSPENLTFAEVDYWKAIVPRDMHNDPIYNVGIFAMEGYYLRSFWDSLYQDWMAFYSWYKTVKVPPIGNGDTFPFNIPFHERVVIDMALTFNRNFDTIAFNTYIKKIAKDTLICANAQLFGCYAFNVETGILRYKNEKLYSGRSLVNVAHFNGDAKQFIYKNYYVGKEVSYVSSSREVRTAGTQTEIR